MEIKVELTKEALSKVKEVRIESLRIRLVEDVLEWSACCVGEVCAIFPRIEVEEGEGDGGMVRAFTKEGVKVYLDPKVFKKVSDKINIHFEDGKFIATGLSLSSEYRFKGPSLTS